ncbi:MAG: peptide chain release factor 3 [Deltaproteobacteria bacterium]|nr:peptide chain release factor 3 [Deltaproteobacteria bacterium]
MKLSEEIERRRTFAIISHPDAGKTTLTEKLLLYGGAVQLAGSVTAKAASRATTSDWMELEKKRGISVSSTVLQFEYDGRCVNLLDTPGHKDFSEDTYRVLTAVDSVVMVIDAAKGIESQTRKLFEICRLRKIPIFTFMNKLDRPSQDPIALLDELEEVLGISAVAINWPLGNGQEFRGIYDRMKKEVHLFERTPGGAYKAPVAVSQLSDPVVKDRLSPRSFASAIEELEILDGAGTAFDKEAVLSGVLTPVLFGSASNNFGVKFLLDFFLENAPQPAPRRSAAGTEIDPQTPAFSGFVFKIQANMDPKHRDRIAFLRICSGVFQRDMQAINPRNEKKVRLASAHKLFGQERQSIETAYAGDVIGLIGAADLGIGDTLTENPEIVYDEIPRFTPECFAYITSSSTAQYKRYQKGLDQLLKEGVAQRFEIPASGGSTLLGAVGPLQFEVLRFRLESEYGALSAIETAPWNIIRWLPASLTKAECEKLDVPRDVRIGTDLDNCVVALFPGEWAVKIFSDRNPEVILQAHPPNRWDGESS